MTPPPFLLARSLRRCSVQSRSFLLARCARCGRLHLDSPCASAILARREERHQNEHASRTRGPTDCPRFQGNLGSSVASRWCRTRVGRCWSRWLGAAGSRGSCRPGWGRGGAPFAIHDRGKIVLGMTVAVALGGDAACDVGLLRAQPGVFGLVASDPTVSRLIATLAEDADGALAAISAARATARERVWNQAGGPAPGGPGVLHPGAP